MSDPEAIIDEPEAAEEPPAPGEVEEDAAAADEPVGDLDLETPEADAVEQRRVVVIDEDEYR
jgi:hypothetical protein